MIVRIKNLRLSTTIGIHKWEKKTKQVVVLNLEMEFDGTAAAQSDHIKDTLDYESLSQSIKTFVEESKFNLIETLADRVLQMVMKDTRLISATLEIDKPGALEIAESVSVVHKVNRV